MIDDLKRLGATSDAKGRGRVHPDKSWHPRSEVEDGIGGFIITEPYEPGSDPDTERLFEMHGLDPDLWVITRARSSRWQQRTRGEEPVWLEASRIEFEPKSVVHRVRVDADKIVAQIAKWRPRSPSTTTDRSFWAPVGDTQIGKPEGGGSQATVARFLSELDRTTERQKQLRAGTVVLPWLGDCIEGVVSQGGKVQGRLDLTITEQVRVHRRLVMAQIKAYAPLADRIRIPAVPGNHDEPGRQLFTVGTDSWALDALSAVEDGIRENPELCSKVEFVYPDHDTLTVTIDDQELRVAMAHGHQFGTSAKYWQNWWDGQIRGRQLVGDADVLLAAHRHHLEVKDFGGSRLFVQIPALDGGSQHWTDRTGDASPSRMVSFTVEGNRVRHFDPVL